MTRYRHLLQQVRNLGRYPTDEEAEQVLDAVLTLLGSRCEFLLLRRGLSGL
ncbi:hypothetical protein [Kitasatospora herbaricolor]|uniref:hypothetical protein n=1 Tax=Kitasatospora herbaricolor TaxID=68217 RepID=UPI0036DA2765